MPLTAERLQNIFPEMFTLSPRTGGFVKIKPKEQKDTDRDKGDNANTSVSRQFRVNNAIRQSVFDEAPRGKITSADLLAVTMTCIILMATDSPKLTYEHVTCAEHYLSCIKTDLDNYPPNIQRMLNHIQNLRDSGKFPEPKVEESPKTVRTSLTVRAGN